MPCQFVRFDEEFRIMLRRGCKPLQATQCRRRMHIVGFEQKRNYSLYYIFRSDKKDNIFVALHVIFRFMEDPRKEKDRLSKKESYSLIVAYYSSGELPSVFYRRVGLSDNQFYGWGRSIWSIIRH